MRSEMTIGKKLLIGFGGMLALVVGLTYISLTWIGSLNRELEIALNKTAKKTELAAQMDAVNAYLRAGQQGVILYSALKDPAMVQKSAARFVADSDRMSKLVGDYKPLIAPQKGRQAVETIQSQTAAWQPLFQQIAQMSADGQFRDINPPVTRTPALADRIQKATDQLQQNQRLHFAEAAEEASSRAGPVGPRDPALRGIAETGPQHGTGDRHRPVGRQDFRGLRGHGGVHRNVPAGEHRKTPFPDGDLPPRP